MNLHQFLHWARTTLHWNYWDDWEVCSYGQLVIGSFITTKRPLIHHILCRGFWWNIKSPRWPSPSIVQIWHPMTSDFSQNWSHLWKGRDFRPLMRFREILQGSWWWLGELCEVLRCLLWRGLRRHCSVYNVSCIFNNCLYFSCYMAGYFLDRLFYVYIPGTLCGLQSLSVYCLILYRNLFIFSHLKSRSVFCPFLLYFLPAPTSLPLRTLLSWTCLFC